MWILSSQIEAISGVDVAGSNFEDASVPKRLQQFSVLMSLKIAKWTAQTRKEIILVPVGNNKKCPFNSAFRYA